ncbi:MAG: DMT family transporter [Chloroflexota bacterium]|nr:MAG: EamA family transporter [Chloroflexota bacterium]
MTQPQSIPARPPVVPPRAYAVIVIGILATSFAAIFIRFAQNEGLPSLSIAAGRLVLASLLLTPFALLRHGTALRGLTRGELALAAVSGALLAVHFASWIASLEYTTVLVSVVLVSTGPLWVALLEFVALGVRLRPPVLVGLAIAIAGGVLIGFGGGESAASGPAPVMGGLLALVGAIAMACYLIIGRKLRVKLSLLPYVWLVYSGAAITLLVAVALTGTPLAGYRPHAYLWIALLAIVPQLVGHSSLNYALRYLSATYVSITTQMEPIGSAIAAFIILREQPSAMQVLGSLAIVIGVIVATYAQQVKPAAAPALSTEAET